MGMNGACGEERMCSMCILYNVRVAEKTRRNSDKKIQVEIFR